MRKKSAAKVGVQPSQGVKKTFDDDEDDQEMVQPIVSSSTSRLGSRREYEDDEDDAPEAVGTSAGRAAESEQFRRAEREAAVKKQAARARGLKIAEAKAQKVLEAAIAENARTKAKGRKGVDGPRGKGKKGVSVNAKGGDEEDDGKEDAETRKLRARMEKAMEDGEGDSEDDSLHTIPGSDGGPEDDEDDDEDEDEDGESFHTESDDANEQDEEDNGEEEDEDDEDDGSETLDDGPVDEATRKLWARMQEAMEAAERRAGIVHPAKSSTSSTSASKSTKSTKPNTLAKSSKPTTTIPAIPSGSKRKAGVLDADDDGAWDMSTGTGGLQPLSTDVLRAAELAHQELKAQKAVKAQIELARRAEGRERTKKKRQKKATSVDTKQLGHGKTLQILRPTLDLSSGGLPPVHEAKSRLGGEASGSKARKRFEKKALKASGQISGQGLVDGRRKVVGL